MDKILFALLCLMVVGLAIAFEPVEQSRPAVERPRVIYVQPIIVQPQDNLPPSFDIPTPTPTPTPTPQPEPPRYRYRYDYGCPGGGCTRYAFPILGAPVRWIYRGFWRIRHNIRYHW